MRGSTERAAGRSRLLAWLLFAVFIAALSSALALDSLSRRPVLDSDNTLVLAVAGIAIIGLVVALRQPRNALAWTFAGTGAWFGLLGLIDSYARYTLVSHPGALPGGVYVAWLYQWWWAPMLVCLLTLPFLLFPDGRLLSSRWKPVVWAVVALAAIGWIPRALVPDLEEYNVRNPFGIEGSQGLLDAVFLGEFFFLAGLALAAASSLVVRFRRAGAVERQQIKWVMLAGALLAVFVAAAIVLGLFGIMLPGALFGLVLALLPLSAGVAILRYRLYDIDVVINRTLVYVSVTALLAGTYVGLVLLLQLALRPVTQENGLAIALSTLAVAALFRPARNRIQALVDRRFYRHKYDAERTLRAFAARLRDEVDLDALRGELTAVVAETMRPAHVSLWLRNGGESLP